MVKTIVLLAVLFVIVVFVWSACRGSVQPAHPLGGKAESGGDRSGGPLAREAVAGVDNTGLAALLADHWDWVLRQAPVWATTLGDRRFDAELSRVSHTAVLETRVTRRSLLERARALPRQEMSRSDQISLDLLVGELDAEVESEVCDFHLWSVSAGSNPAAAYNRLHEQHHVRNGEDARHLVARYRQIARNIDDEIDNLRRGAAAGLFSSRESLRRALQMIDGQLAQPVEKWTLYQPVSAPPRIEWTQAEEQRFTTDLSRILREQVRPALARYRGFLNDEIVPRARDDHAEGIGALPRGEACYRARIKTYTGMAIDSRDLHELGQREIARINGEMRDLGTKLFATDNLQAVIERLRSDRALYFHERAEVKAAAQRALDAARARMPDFFAKLPRTDVVVVEIPDYEAPYTYIAYYREPHFDGSKPGEYFINTYKPEVRPRFEMAVLAFHEAIPGHHLQIALSMERGVIPAFRRFGGNTAYVEGWALYSEGLAEEMGLYADDLDRMGRLSYDAWRAARLVVDTGIHAFGWTRARAEKFMLEHTALTAENIANEVDRYISWPGQALAYKVGQLEISKLRKQAEQELDGKFDLRAFHDAVLENGAVTLPVLRAQIERWVTSRKRAPL
jgi:uncharacterized protein (DUF885 family)